MVRTSNMQEFGISVPTHSTSFLASIYGFRSFVPKVAFVPISYTTCHTWEGIGYELLDHNMRSVNDQVPEPSTALSSCHLASHPKATSWDRPGLIGA